jgi:hypothetical protein
MGRQKIRERRYFICVVFTTIVVVEEVAIVEVRQARPLFKHESLLVRHRTAYGQDTRHARVGKVYGGHWVVHVPVAKPSKRDNKREGEGDMKNGGKEERFL